ncbi:hypothetical protein PtA15_14A216 [Puccinia triticina]|uniref:Uncharacterized protein n=1 Tax=Puccinia triticina TaxID=208348 RepID=A0ABY7D416_9BASI|nr:uncharacterized protein PtA15_14A216 [Puccinia triticina]WAQ91333.1 hypothetical protein PtA15_14A216 [Puccinia triticina]
MLSPPPSGSPIPVTPHNSCVPASQTPGQDYRTLGLARFITQSRQLSSSRTQATPPSLPLPSQTAPVPLSLSTFLGQPITLLYPQAPLPCHHLRLSSPPTQLAPTLTNQSPLNKRTEHAHPTADIIDATGSLSITPDHALSLTSISPGAAPLLVMANDISSQPFRYHLLCVQQIQLSTPSPPTFHHPNLQTTLPYQSQCTQLAKAKLIPCLQSSHLQVLMKPRPACLTHAQNSQLMINHQPLIPKR